jgi:hypothetical protein
MRADAVDVRAVSPPLAQRNVPQDFYGQLTLTSAATLTALPGPRWQRATGTRCSSMVQRQYQSKPCVGLHPSLCIHLTGRA